ncbi:glycoside hydrolase family 5 protein [Roseateles sp. P5_E7]
MIRFSPASLAAPLLGRAALTLAVALVTACGGGAAEAAGAGPVTASTPATTTCTNPTTVMPNQSGTALPFCASLSADPDGDGQGTEGGKACQMRTGFDITAAMGSGWNLGNTLDATGQTADTLADETNWGNPRTTQAIVDAVKKAGFSSLRLPVSWDDHVSGTGWTIHKPWLDRVEEVAGYALASGMTVIVNIHHNGGWEAPTLGNEARAADVLGKLWPQIAQRFEKYDHRVVFETMNEPRVSVAGVDDWWGKPEYYAVLNRLNVVALNAIRATGGNNLRRLVMLPGYAATATAEQTNALVLPKDKNIAVSVHAYSPYDFALNQKGGSVFSGQAELDEMFTRLNSKFIQNGTPVVMGEWASTDKNNLAERVKHAAYFARGARKAGIPAFWWDNGNMVWSATSTDIMGVIDRRTLAVARPEIVDAIMCATR